MFNGKILFTLNLLYFNMDITNYIYVIQNFHSEFKNFTELF